MGVRVIHGDCREVLPTLETASFDCVVTSPPYFGLRDYGVEGQIGLEPTLDAYIEALCGVFDELWRVLKSTGTAWLNLGDSYAGGGRGGGSPNCKTRTNVGSLVAPTPLSATGLKPKDLIGVPWRVAFALQARGWWLRSAIVWHKPNPMPESVRDRPTSAYEMVFLMTKSERYFFDTASIAEISAYPGDNRALRTDTRKALDIICADNGSRARTGNPTGETRNARNVWIIATQPYSGAHFATMPRDLAERCIKAGCPEGGHVLDPFGGAGTTGLVADRLGRNATLIELNPSYRDMAADRVRSDAPLFADVS